jgi:hypothetical protein
MNKKQPPPKNPKLLSASYVPVEWMHRLKWAWPEDVLGTEGTAQESCSVLPEEEPTSRYLPVGSAVGGGLALRDRV